MGGHLFASNRGHSICETGSSVKHSKSHIGHSLEDYTETYVSFVESTPEHHQLEICQDAGMTSSSRYSLSVCRGLCGRNNSTARQREPEPTTRFFVLEMVDIISMKS